MSASETGWDLSSARASESDLVTVSVMDSGSGWHFQTGCKSDFARATEFASAKTTDSDSPTASDLAFVSGWESVTASSTGSGSTIETDWATRFH